MTNGATAAQGKVFLDLSMSLDGFIAGPNVDVERPMGVGGERLHDWMFRGKTEREADVFEEQFFNSTGAIVMGRRTFDVGVGPWGENPTFHAPCFVLSRDARPMITKEGGATYTFITDGVGSALAQARAAAGDKDVRILGGANTAQHYLRARLLDEIQIHLVPVLLGAGTRLFDHLGTEPVELESIKVIKSPDVTHLRFRVVR